jgi:hypothetical protein
MIVELRDYELKMSRNDQEEFDMFVKRDKDDESLDTVSQKRLLQLYDQYIVSRKARR